MKAVVFEKYGAPDVLQLKELQKPSPKSDEVLIKVQAASVTKYDCWVRRRTGPPGFGFLVRLTSGNTPKQPVLGTELSGIIEQAGENVVGLKPGDQVIGYNGMVLGACAEYICLPESSVVHKPENISFEEAAGFLQGALTAMYFLQKANIQPAQKVLIYGASGGVGGYAVQLAKNYFGAQVTGVCSTTKLAYVKSLGADHVIDYRQEDFTQNGVHYDVIFDTVGKSSVPKSRKSLTAQGHYLFATFGLGTLFQMVWFSVFGNQKFVFGALKERNEDLVLMKDLVEDGTVKAVVDRCFAIEQTCDAHAYVESGHKQGGVIIRINQEKIPLGID